MREIDSIMEKLIILKRDKISIAGYFIKGVGPCTGKGAALTEMYCNFEGFSMKFVQNEFLSRNTDAVQVNISISNLPNITREKLNEDAKYVFEELQNKHLQEVLKAVLPTVSV